MKVNKFNKFWIFILCFSASVISCQKALDINVDPNKAPSATPALVLPAAQVGMAITIGTWNYIGSIWGQYWTGGEGVSTDPLEKYSMTGSDVETSWNQAYSKSLQDMSFLIKSGQPKYAGMGKIMSAYLYQMLTDLFGDIPFSEALKGAPEDGSILAPKYDKPQDVYAALIPMIDDAIANLQETGPLVAIPGSEDLIYGGNINKWIAFANTLKLKILIRQGKSADALALISSGATFIDENSNAKVDFTESSRNANPFYTKFESSGLHMYFLAAQASIADLLAAGDPRIAGLYTKATAGANSGLYYGVRSGQVNIDAEYQLSGGQTAENKRKEYSNVGAAVYGYNIPVYFISAWESKFLQAEAVIKEGGNATTLINDGIQASCNVLGVGSDGPAYISALAFNSSAPIDDQLDVLGVQKWVSMNGLQMIEGWLESVRFDRPGHLIFSGASGIFTDPTQNTLGARKYPSSFVYPTQEVSNNPHTPAGRAVSDKRFWDN